jgi:hypothetical protein
MKCEICDRKNAENVGILCGKHQACMLCITKLVSKAVNAKKNKRCC